MTAEGAGLSGRERMVATIQRAMGCERRAHYGNIKQPYCGLHGGYGVWPCAESANTADALIAASFGDVARAWDEGVEAYRSRYERDESLPLINPYG